MRERGAQCEVCGERAGGSRMERELAAAWLAVACLGHCRLGVASSWSVLPRQEQQGRRGQQRQRPQVAAALGRTPTQARTLHTSAVDMMSFWGSESSVCGAQCVCASYGDVRMLARCIRTQAAQCAYVHVCGVVIRGRGRGLGAHTPNTLLQSSSDCSTRAGCLLPPTCSE